MCDASLAMAIDYAEARVQFDEPISSHQVIQHKLVDMLHPTELGRVGVHFAAWASDVDDAHRPRAASIAKAQMGEAAVLVTGENIQVHGAVGFTWDSRPSCSTSGPSRTTCSAAAGLAPPAGRRRSCSTRADA